jgi:hypothetical protein
MMAQLKCGSGVPFVRLKRLEHQLGIPINSLRAINRKH